MRITIFVTLTLLAMHKKRTWFNRLTASERISLTCPHYFKNLKTYLLVFSLIIVGSIALILSFLGASITTLIIALISIFLAYFIIRYFARNIQASLIKGGTLIFTDLNQRSYVTSIRSLKNVRSVHLGSIQLTRLKYQLDGITRKAIIINNDNFIPFNTDRFLLKAREIYKKQKANL